MHHFNIHVQFGLVAATHLTPLLEGDGEDGMGAAAVLIHLGGPCGSQHGALGEDVGHLPVAAHLLLDGPGQAHPPSCNLPDVHDRLRSLIQHQQILYLFLHAHHLSSDMALS